MTATTTSFDTPRVFGHHNPFASFSDTTDDPLAQATSNSGGFGTPNSGNNTSTDPWSSYYNQPVASTSSNPSSNSALANAVDEESIPGLYIQAWNAAVTASSTTTSSFGSTFNTGNTISLGVLQKMLSGCAGLGASETEKVINLVSGSAGNLAGSYANLGAGSPTSPYRSTQSGGSSSSNGRIAKLEFYVALALAALAQQKEPLSIQAVSSRRDNLPIPKLDLSSLQGTNSTLTRRPSNTRNPSSPTTPYSRAHKMSLGSASDPWGSTVDRNVTSNAPIPNGQSSSSPTGNTNDPFTVSPTKYTASQPPMYSPPRNAGHQHHPNNRSTDHNGYSSFPSYRDDDEDTLGGHGQEPTSSSAAHHQITGRSSDSNLLSLPPYTSALDLHNSLERIAVIQHDELQGNFLTRHTVYKVVQERKGTEVLRRYSDWSSLHEYLEAKYAGRLRLALPPKRMGISARHVHIPSDEQFLLRRRRGLSRYLNLLINHPIYKSDPVLRAFFNEHTLDFSTWRKAHLTSHTVTEGVNDEASLIGKLSASQESLIPTSFESVVTTLREALPGLIEALTRVCALFERVNHRNQQNADDLLRLRLSFDSFGEIYKGLNTGGGHSGRPREIEEETIILNRDLSKLSSDVGTMAEMTEGHVGHFEGEIILENKLKLQRDLWRSLLVLLNKYDSKLKHDNIDKIKKRIEGNQSKYSTINNTPPQNRKSNAEEEMRRIIKLIEDDQNEIERLLNRRVFFKWSTCAEIRLAWRWSTLLRVDLEELAVEENKFYSQISRIWGGLEDALTIGT